MHLQSLWAFRICPGSVLRLHNYIRAVPGKKVLGRGTELENGGTTNTIFSFFTPQPTQFECVKDPPPPYFYYNL